MTDRALRVLSLGAGVQSSTLLMMADRGEIGPRPDFAVYANVKSESKRVQSWLDWLEGQVSIPIVRVSRGSLRENLLSDAEGRFVSVPFFTNANGEVGMGRRQCTREFKIEAIESAIKHALGLKPRQRGPKHIAVEQWIGISFDERQRMKESRLRYVRHRFPLVECRLTRGHCLEWWDLNFPGIRPPRSACTFCPFREDAEWIDMRDNDPESFADACLVDLSVRRPGARIAKGMNAQFFVHRSLKPLGEVAFIPNDKQAAFEYGFANECEGMCGV